MTRYNLFHRIHKGLRALLYDSSLLLQRTDFTIAGESREAVCRLKFVISLFEKYQQSEDIYILPALTTYEPGVAASIEQEHEEAYHLSCKLERLIKDLVKATLPLEQMAVSNELITQFEEFMLFTILYMAREKNVVNEALWRYYAEGELQQIAWKIIGDVEPSFMSPYSKWMIRGLNNNEIVRWLKEVRHTAKEADFQQLLKTAEAELQPGRWDLLQDVLETSVMVA